MRLKPPIFANFAYFYNQTVASRNILNINKNHMYWILINIGREVFSLEQSWDFAAMKGS